MESYTIEDIEVIRSKSGISYQEAVALLDYHNGNLARALIDLERNGRLVEKDGDASSVRRTSYAGNRRGGIFGILGKLYRTRLKIKRNKTVTIANVSILYLILAALIAPHLTIGSAIASVLLGYSFSFDSNDAAFVGENFEALVRNAKDNAKNTVHSVVSTFSGSDLKEQVSAADTKNSVTMGIPEKSPENVINVTADLPEVPVAPGAVDSYYTANPAVARATVFSAASDVPTLQVPVQVESVEGNVKVENHNDGSATVSIG